MSAVRVLELRSVWGTGGGPEKTILLGTARTDPRRFEITVCYLRQIDDAVFGIDGRAEALGLDYVEIRERHSFDPAIWTQLRRIVRERRIDIVHAHDYKTNALAALLHRIDGVRILSTVHGWTGHSTRERILYYPLDKQNLARFPAVITVSDDIRNELLKRGARPEVVRTILNGIDHRAFWRDRSREADVRASLSIAPGDIVLGAVGRLEPQKRFAVLIDTFVDLRRQHPSLRLLIVGDGSLKTKLQTHIDSLSLGSVCRLLGHREDVADVHHAFDLFVQSSDYEGTPNAVLESMALGTPLVATAAGGTAQLVRHEIDGLIVPTGDTRALGTAIAQALADPAAAEARATKARHRVETDLSFDARLAAVERVYDALMNSPSRTVGTRNTVGEAEALTTRRP